MGYLISGGQSVRVQSNTITSLREAITDVSRTIEDLTWTNLSQDNHTVGVDEEWTQRKDLLKRFRVYRRRSPLAKQAFNLLKNYVLGQGVTIRPNNKATVAKVVDDFWDDPVNRATFTSYDAMVQSLDFLYTDGDLFLVLFPDRESGTVQLSWMDAWRVQDIITDPDNWRVPLWYKVKASTTKFDFKSGSYNPTDGSEEFVYYRDYRNDPDSSEYIENSSGNRPSDKLIIKDAFIFHVAINKRGKFGESELAAAADWLKAHKDFMEDRATLSRAAAQIAWRKKRKGPASDVANQVSRLQSSLVQNLSRWETNPANASGSTLIENDGSTMEWVKTDTGSGNALNDERLIRMMVGSALGVMNHYFGDEAQANLATATAMELPMLKMYEGWQKLLGDTVKTLIRYVLTIANEAGRIGPEDKATKYKRDKKESPFSTPTLGSLQEAFAASLTNEERDWWINEATPLSVVTTTTPKSVDDNEFDATGEVDWYVDVDFPPIIQREVAAYIAALKNLFSMMPVLNIESQKLAVSMALTALGVNDIDEVMSKLFSGDFSNAAFAVMPIQQTGSLPPGSLNPVGQAGNSGAQPGVPKQAANASLPVGKEQPPTDRPQNDMGSK